MVPAVRVHSRGGTLSLQYDDIRVPPPPEFHVEVRHTAIVASSYDLRASEGYFRGYSSSGVRYPFTLGLSGVGVITEVGSGVLDLQIGQRVGYFNALETGSFSEQRVIAAKYLFPLPPDLSDDEVASILFEGLVAWMLLRRVFPVKRGHRVLIHEIRSGLASLLGQWSRILGATVVGTITSEEKLSNAEKIGFDHVILHSEIEQLLEITDGSGVDVIFDCLGGETISDFVGSLATRGMLVLAGEPAPNFSLSEVAEKGQSLSICFPIVQDFIERREDLLAASSEIFTLLKLESLSFSVKEKYALEKAAQALQGLRQQKGLGSVILQPPIPDPTRIPHGS